MLSSLLAVFLFGTPGADEHASYLFHMQAGPDQKSQMRGERFNPQPGDIVLFDDHSPLTAKVYRFIGTGNPLHAAIIFRKDDGSLGILEAGTNAVMKIFNFDLEPRLHGFDGTILIRRLKSPLAPEQSKQLTQFAQAQEGKSYAIGRLLMQLTPLRPRSLPFAQHFGRTVVDRDRWICSELVIAAAATAEIWDVHEYPANLMYPRDLCYDERYDLSPYYDTPGLWYPRPELEHFGDGVRVGRPKN
jgi:hypothetical protein